MERRPCSPYQPWPISRSTSPLTIPSPRLHSLNPTVNAEWQKLRFERTGPQFRYTPRGMSRPHTPPSLSPSPSPSASSCYTDQRDDDIEIEELTGDREEGDSGIELLIGEYEEAPENYRKDTMYDSEEEDIAQSHKSILYGLERLSARNRSPSPMVAFKTAMQQRLQRERALPKKSKRSYAESSGSDCSSYDGGLDWEDPGRRTRRRVMRRIPDDCVSIHSFDGSSNASSDNEIDMEL